MLMGYQYEWQKFIRFLLSIEMPHPFLAARRVRYKNRGLRNKVVEEWSLSLKILPNRTRNGDANPNAYEYKK